ncbi:hypothetical protein PUND_a2476 [Pseudoalteromonas undina]|nr:hypothetical protein PUND_a2476 [Pseudoalteromonas undina]
MDIFTIYLGKAEVTFMAVFAKKKYDVLGRTEKSMVPSDNIKSKFLW